MNPYVQLTIKANGEDMGTVPVTVNAPGKFELGDACYGLLETLELIAETKLPHAGEDAQGDEVGRMHEEIVSKCCETLDPETTYRAPFGSFDYEGLRIEWFAETDEAWEARQDARPLVEMLGQRAVWSAVLAPEILALPCGSEVARACMRVISDADMLVSRMPDVALLAPHLITSIRAAVARQCSVFMFA